MKKSTLITDAEIVKLLKEGKSYNDIIAEYFVSPNRISIAKKRAEIKEANKKGK